MPIHRIDCVPTHGNLYSVWMQGRLLVPETSEPSSDARDRLQRLGYSGLMEVWCSDKPYLLKVEPIRN